MSNGKKQESSRSQSKKPPDGYEVWFEEYEYMARFAAKADARGQSDTYWHKRKAELEAAFKEYNLEVPNG